MKRNMLGRQASPTWKSHREASLEGKAKGDSGKQEQPPNREQSWRQTSHGGSGKQEHSQRKIRGDKLWRQGGNDNWSKNPSPILELSYRKKNTATIFNFYFLAKKTWVKENQQLGLGKIQLAKPIYGTKQLVKQFPCATTSCAYPRAFFKLEQQVIQFLQPTTTQWNCFFSNFEPPPQGIESYLKVEFAGAVQITWDSKSHTTMVKPATNHQKPKFHAQEISSLHKPYAQGQRLTCLNLRHEHQKVCLGHRQHFTSPLELRRPSGQF